MPKRMLNVWVLHRVLDEWDLRLCRLVPSSHCGHIMTSELMTTRSALGVVIYRRLSIGGVAGWLSTGMLVTVYRVYRLPKAIDQLC